MKLIEDYDFIMPSTGYDDIYKAITDKAAVSPRIKYYIGSDSAIIGMVASHLGISIMSELQLKFIGNGVACKEFAEDFHRNYFTNPSNVSPLGR